MMLAWCCSNVSKCFFLAALLLLIIAAPAPSACDNDCRRVNEFFNFITGKAEEYKEPECSYCVFADGCDNTNAAPGGTCAIDYTELQTIKYWSSGVGVCVGVGLTVTEGIKAGMLVNTDMNVAGVTKCL